MQIYANIYAIWIYVHKCIHIYIYNIYIYPGLNTSKAFVKENQISLNILVKIKLGNN